MAHYREMNLHSGEQEMAHDPDINFNVYSGKQEMMQDREMNFHSGEHAVEQCSLPRRRGLCGVYVRLMGGVDDIYTMSI